MAEIRFHRQSLFERFRVFYNELDQCADRTNLSRSHSRTRWQAKYPLTESLSLRQAQAGLRIISPIRFHLMTAGIKVAARQDVFSPQDIVQLVPSNSHCIFINLQNDILIVAFFVLVER